MQPQINHLLDIFSLDQKFDCLTTSNVYEKYCFGTISMVNSGA